MSSTAKIFNTIVKAYDVRGTVGETLTEPICHALGHATAVEFGADEIIVARDMRSSGIALSEAFMSGVRSTGVSTCDIGLASTDLLYFASGSENKPGAMFTASHNPAQYNGIKLCRAGAAPVSLDSGLASIRDRAIAIHDSGSQSTETATSGSHRVDEGFVERFADHVRSFVDTSSFSGLRVVVDAGNGMGGLVVPAVFDELDAEIIPLFFDLDGTFPNHPANPLEPENLRDLTASVVEHRADLGLAFDGDADRMFCVDADGQPVSPSAITALIAKIMLARTPGATVLYNVICSAAVPEAVIEAGGTPVRTRVGHSYIKEVMAETGAVFGGEHSAHYYFKDNYRADSGLIAAVMLLEALGQSNGTLAHLVAPFNRYAASGEINRTVSDTADSLANVAAAFVDEADVTEPDGILVNGDGWWFSLRPSNTEPVVRLNVEADDDETMSTIRDRVLTLVEG